MLLKLVIIVSLAYLALLALLYVYQERLLFYPEVLPSGYKYSFSHTFEEVSWEVEGATINALHFKADDPRGAVLYLHGNAGSLRSWGMIASDFLEREYAVLIPDYRGYGKSTGKIRNEEMLLEDALKGYAYLEERYPEHQIIVYGRSIGTGPATYVASLRSPRMLILESPYYSVEDLARKQFPYIPAFVLKYPLRTDKWISQVSCPVYLFHGTRDEFIPFSNSLRLEPLIKTEHELYAIEGAGHNDLEHFEDYHEKLAQILD